MMFLRESLRRRKRGELGFSFIELVIVVAVIGILTSIAIPSYGAIQSNAKQAAVEANAQTGYRLVAATMAGFDVQASATTSGKAVKTPQQALDTLKNEDIDLSFLDKSGATIDNPGEDFCVYAYNKNEGSRDDGKPRYFSLVGDCPVVAPNYPGVTTPEEPAPEPSNPPVTTEPTPDPTPSPADPTPAPTPEVPAGSLPGEPSNVKDVYDPDSISPRVNFSNQNLLVPKLVVHEETSYLIRKDTTAAASTRVIFSHRHDPSRSEIYLNRAPAGLTSLDVVDDRIYYSINNVITSQLIASQSDKKTITLPHTVADFAATKNGSIFYISDSQLWFYDSEDQSNTRLDNVAEGARNVRLGTDGLYYIGNAGLYRVDLITKQSKQVSSQVYTDIYASDGYLVGAQDSSIYKIDSSTGARVTLANLVNSGRSFEPKAVTVTKNGAIMFLYNGYLYRMQ